MKELIQKNVKKKNKKIEDNFANLENFSSSLMDIEKITNKANNFKTSLIKIVSFIMFLLFIYILYRLYKAYGKKKNNSSSILEKDISNILTNFN